MHIHPSSPNSSQSEDDAARTIQAGFRGYRVRKQLRQAKRMKENKSQNGHSENGSYHSYATHNPRGQVRGLEDQSATKIQAGIRGYLVRKRQKIEKEAAVKIQASFRGFKTRKNLHKDDDGSQ